MFLSCTPFVVNTTFSTGIVGVEVTSVSWLVLTTKGVQERNIQMLDQMTVGNRSQETEVNSTPTRHFENVVLTTKGLLERNIQMLDGTTVENKSKIINYSNY